MGNSTSKSEQKEQSESGKILDDIAFDIFPDKSLFSEKLDEENQDIINDVTPSSKFEDMI